MSETLRKWAKHEAKKNRPEEKPLSREERMSLHKLRREAKAAGTTLKSGGKGGLSPSLVLAVMRRDKYRCKVCGSQDDIGIHHKAGIVESKWLSKKGHKNTPNNLVTICEPCHDRLHSKARAEGTDSSQVLPEADIGTKHDKGQPRYSDA